VIALTANAMPADREAAAQAGMDDLVPKAVKSPALFAAMAKWFLRGREPAETTAAPSGSA
jgi:CheY-like chemotaxis protein